jgi:hypothetical protein
MPIEIRELIIKAEVNEQGNRGGDSGRPGSDAKKQIIQECVDMVMEIIRKEKER